MCPASTSLAPTNRHSGGIAATRSPRCARTSGRSSPGSAPPGPGGAASPLPGPGGGSHGTAFARASLRQWCGSASPSVLAPARPPRVGAASWRIPPTGSSRRSPPACGSSLSSAPARPPPPGPRPLSLDHPLELLPVGLGVDVDLLLRIPAQVRVGQRQPVLLDQRHELAEELLPQVVVRLPLDAPAP